jgi:hypothetical protein
MIMVEGNIDLSMRVSVDKDGKLSFYIHPANRDGYTMDYTVNGNELSPVYNKK